MWVICSWLEQSLSKKLAIRSKNFIFLIGFCTAFPLFMPKSVSLMTLFALKKCRLWAFRSVALYKRATGGIHSFSRANHSFALSHTKNELFARKTKERIPNPEWMVLCLCASEWMLLCMCASEWMLLCLCASFSFCILVFVSGGTWYSCPVLSEIKGQLDKRMMGVTRPHRYPTFLFISVYS